MDFLTGFLTFLNKPVVVMVHIYGLVNAYFVYLVPHALGYPKSPRRCDIERRRTRTPQGCLKGGMPPSPCATHVQGYNLNKELLEEIERLQKKGSHFSSSDDLLAIEQVSGSPLSSGRSNTSSRRKRRRNGVKEVEVSPSVGSQHDHILPEQSVNTLDKENIFSGPFSHANQPTCCRQRLDPSVNASDSRICMFQELVECLLDLKFSIPTQTDDNVIISAVHESSGYSFSLGWVKNSEGEEELMYRVSSLGTFERVAPEWMRDVMLFSKSMCTVFFNRVSGIVKLG
ncbi:hypothetical protein CTI12_AA567870 [Artemisia annua]|uniref:DUF7806 domain-containing protein n=1 Tax=Artemisia annua TaxID=35608 RepID=A0A2U1KSN8_ARTAN|nr:hypothetical protein CTI12_AA567870 [Artemisia annua]